MVQSRVEDSRVPGRGPSGVDDGKEPKGTPVQAEIPGEGPTEKSVDPKPAENDSPKKKPGGLISGVVGSLGL